MAQSDSGGVVMAKEKRKRPFQWRALVALSLLGAGTILSLSGVILYIAPSGRVAKTIEWHLLWLDKDQWEAVHTGFGIFFIILFGYHLKYNWRSIVAYSRRKLASAIKLRTELAWSTFLVFGLLAIAILDLPPIRPIMDFGESFGTYWERWGEGHGYYVTSEEEAHEEEAPDISGKGWGRLTVATLAEEKGISVDEALARLSAAGIEAKPDDYLLTLSGKSGFSPKEIADLVDTTNDAQ